MIKKCKEYKVWIIAAVIIPLITVGYDYLEKTTFYNKVTGTFALESAVEKLYSGEPGVNNGLFHESLGINTQEFDKLIKIVETREDYEEGLVPTFIMRFALKNAPYTNTPADLSENLDYVGGEGRKQSILGADFSPAVLGVCPPSNVREPFSQCKIRVIGNRYELERMIEERKGGFRLKFNLAITMLSILFAVMLKTRRSKC